MTARRPAETEVRADQLLAAAMRDSARTEREACARAVCTLCADGQPVIFDSKRARYFTTREIRSALAITTAGADEVARADALKRHHTRWCAICRDGDAELCIQHGAAGAADLFRDHLRTCRDSCRGRLGRQPTVCAEGARLRTEMRRAACVGARRIAREARARAVIAELDYPNEYFHVESSGRIVRCPASAIWLRGPAPPADPPVERA